MRISDWSSDVCSSDLNDWVRGEGHAGLGYINIKGGEAGGPIAKNHGEEGTAKLIAALGLGLDDGVFFAAGKEKDAAKLAGLARTRVGERSEEHTSELQSLMRISYAVFCLKKKKKRKEQERAS